MSSRRTATTAYAYPFETTLLPLAPYFVTAGWRSGKRQLLAVLCQHAPAQHEFAYYPGAASSRRVLSKFNTPSRSAHVLK
jgi:hypothetical protein